MTDEQPTQQTEPNDHISEDSIPDDATRSSESTPIQKRPRELPRRGYEGAPRPMSPPPPPPISPSRSSFSSSPPPPHEPERGYQPRVEPVIEQPPPPPARASYAEYARRPRRQSKSDSGLYLPWWSLVLLIMVVGVGAFGLLYIVLQTGSSLTGNQTPRVVVVTNSRQDEFNNSGSGNVNQGPPGSIPTTLAPIATAVPIAVPTATPPGVTTGCPLDTIVEVVGVSPNPLLIRPEPRQDDNWTSQALEGEQLRIVGGPETSTGLSGTLEWCQVAGVTNPVHSGWAARDYLVIVSE